MKYLVTRTSVWGDDVPPCPEATQETYDRYGYYTFKTVAEANRKYPEQRFEKVKGVAGVRTEVQPNSGKGWFVEFETLDELLGFIDSHGRCVIGGVAHDNRAIPELEIYDDYRE